MSALEARPGVLRCGICLRMNARPRVNEAGEYCGKACDGECHEVLKELAELAASSVEGVGEQRRPVRSVDSERANALLARMQKPRVASVPRQESTPHWKVADVARFLKVSKQWVYKHAALDNIPHSRFGAALRFDQAAVRRYAEQAGVAPESAEALAP